MRFRSKDGTVRRGVKAKTAQDALCTSSDTHSGKPCAEAPLAHGAQLGNPYKRLFTRDNRFAQLRPSAQKHKP